MFSYNIDEDYILHRAARVGDLEKLTNLIQSGLHDVNKPTTDLVRPLHEASLSGHFQCIKLLVENGAEINTRNIDGATPLCDASSNGSVESVTYLLDHGAFVNPPLLMTSPLHEAVLRGRTECVEILIKAGAKLNLSDIYFGTPLHVAAYKDNAACAAILLRYGADVNASKTHHTALHDAARHQNSHFIRLLLNHGADVHAKNNQGLVAKDLIPSSTSPVKQILVHWECMPHSLRHTCRVLVRRLLGCSRLQLIDGFNIPKMLKEYLKFT